MAIIKNHLTETFNAINIPNLVQYTTANYSPYDPGQYLYRLVAEIPSEEKFSDTFIELAYTTLIAWNMNQRAARLSDFPTFKNSILLLKETIQSLNNIRIEKTSDKNKIEETVGFLFKNLDLVAEGKPKLVTFSKTLHYFLPSLLMPIDRAYTLNFFYNDTNVPKDDVGQFKMYYEIFLQFRELALKYNFDAHIDLHWNRNVPKIIDNVIIAHIKQKVQVP